MAGAGLKHLFVYLTALEEEVVDVVVEFFCYLVYVNRLGCPIAQAVFLLRV